MAEERCPEKVGLPTDTRKCLILTVMRHLRPFPALLPKPPQWSNLNWSVKAVQGAAAPTPVPRARFGGDVTMFAVCLLVPRCSG